MQDAAKDLGVEFNYKYADGDLQQEVADIENFVEMGTNYIIVGPVSYTHLDVYKRQTFWLSDHKNDIRRTVIYGVL